MNRDNKLVVIYLGFSGSLSGTASSEKAKLILKALTSIGACVTFIYKRWNVPDNKNIISINEINNNNVNYIQSSNNIIRPNNFLIRNIIRLILNFKEIIVIHKLNKITKISYGIVVTRSFLELLIYRFISEWLKFKIVLNYMEYSSEMVTRNKIGNIINDILFDKYAFKLIDGGLPISNFLKNVMYKSNPNLKTLKLPVLVDIDLFENIICKNKKNYFLYCGGAAYIDVIEFVINSFELVQNNKILLKLICHGTDNELRKIKRLIFKSNKSNLIILLHHLAYDNLVKNYKEALALLVPIRETLQDKARFPNKIGEYASSGRPIISNKFGEIVNYFQDGVNAFLVDKYKIELFADKMNFIIKNPDEATFVGLNGKKIAFENFEYSIYGKKLVQFFEKLKD